MAFELIGDLNFELLLLSSLGQNYVIDVEVDYWPNAI